MKSNAECLPCKDSDCSVISENLSDPDPFLISENERISNIELLQNASHEISHAEVFQQVTEASNHQSNIMHSPQSQAWQLDSTALRESVLGLSVIVGASGMFLTYLGIRLRSLDIRLPFGNPSRASDSDVSFPWASFSGTRAAGSDLGERADRDSLTGVLSRLQLVDLGDHLFEELRRDDAARGAAAPDPVAGSGASLGLLCFNVNQFRSVNAELGYEAGDGLLREIGNRFRQVVRLYHLPSAALARMSGDEFALLLPNPNQSTLRRLGKDILSALSKPFVWQGHQNTVSYRMAAAIADVKSLNRFSDLIAQVTTAMSDAKGAQSAASDKIVLDDIVFFDPESAHRERSQTKLKRSLSQAISLQQFRMHYQPIVDLAHPTRFRTVGFEALIRWQHPDMGLLQPAQFLPLATEMGLMIQLDRWVMERVCRQIVTWQRSGAAMDGLIVNINLSAGHLADPGLVPYIQRLLTYYPISPQQLNLEVTEGELIIDLDRAANVLRQIRTLGISISLDDFGTGYSALSYLDRLPADVLKIDRSFIHRMSVANASTATNGLVAQSSQSPQLIVKAILNLAEALNMRVVAEGIENSSQLEQLQAMGCGYGQGYLFSRPTDAQNAQDFLSL